MKVSDKSDDRVLFGARTGSRSERQHVDFLQGLGVSPPRRSTPVHEQALAARRRQPDIEAAELAVTDVTGGRARREGARAGVGQGSFRAFPFSRLRSQPGREPLTIPSGCNAMREKNGPVSIGWHRRVRRVVWRGFPGGKPVAAPNGAERRAFRDRGRRERASRRRRRRPPCGPRSCRSACGASPPDRDRPRAAGTPRRSCCASCSRA